MRVALSIVVLNSFEGKRSTVTWSNPCVNGMSDVMPWYGEGMRLRRARAQQGWDRVEAKGSFIFKELLFN